MLTAGEDLDSRTMRELKSDYTLPTAFGDALRESGVTEAQLSFPDIGLTFQREPTRLHWTDTLRHSGKNVPTFGYMAAADVEAALSIADPAAAARELLSAASTYANRDRFERTRYDRAILTTTAGQPLLDALYAFYNRPRPAGDPGPALPPWDDVKDGVAAQVALIDPTTQAQIAQCVLALVLAADLRDQALTRPGAMTLKEWSDFADMYTGSRGTNDALTASRNASKVMDFDVLSRAAQLTVRAVESLRLALSKRPPPMAARLSVTGPLGRIVLALDDEKDTWTAADCFLLVDTGGDDTYLDDIAANKDLWHPIAAVLDLAGNDTYKPSFDWRIEDKVIPGEFNDVSARQGAGLFGVGVLVDGAGDDSYMCPNHCQGYGLFGAGVLIDRGGNDTYKGYVLSQGAAEFGYGVLLDTGAGRDHYESLQQAEGFGGTRGIGWLVDDGGNDEYLAIENPIVYNWANENTNWSGSQGFGFGTRVLPGGPYLSGGLGGLFDLDGDDSYQCAVMCQGFGYFFGTGLFYDKRGKDKYVVTHKYGIGGATHQSVGIFLDGGGADTYEYPGHGRTGGGEGVGLGYDLGVAYHIDRGNDKDVYSFLVDVGFVMGYARFPALGVLINEGGDDEYHIAGATAGMSSLGGSWNAAGARNPGLGTTNSINLGMFLDLGGKNDVYDVMNKAVKNGATWKQTMPYGDGWDMSLDHGYGFDSE